LQKQTLKNNRLTASTIGEHLDEPKKRKWPETDHELPKFTQKACENETQLKKSILFDSRV
jgi:hypothetical protein